MPDQESVSAADEFAEQIWEGLDGLAASARGTIIPANVVYRMLGNLKKVEQLLPEAFTQLSDGLIVGLTQYVVTEADGADPVEQTRIAAEHLQEAGRLAAELGQQLQLAQTALSNQRWEYGS